MRYKGDAHFHGCTHPEGRQQKEQNRHRMCKEAAACGDGELATELARHWRGGRPPLSNSARTQLDRLSKPFSASVASIAGSNVPKTKHSISAGAMSPTFDAHLLL